MVPNLSNAAGANVGRGNGNDDAASKVVAGHTAVLTARRSAGQASRVAVPGVLLRGARLRGCGEGMTPENGQRAA